MLQFCWNIWTFQEYKSYIFLIRRFYFKETMQILYKSGFKLSMVMWRKNLVTFLKSSLTLLLYVLTTKGSFYDFAFNFYSAIEWSLLTNKYYVIQGKIRNKKDTSKLPGSRTRPDQHCTFPLLWSGEYEVISPALTNQYMCVPVCQCCCIYLHS